MSNIFFLAPVYLIIFFIFLHISKSLKLYDQPNSRKIHTTKVLNTGGLAFYAFLILIVSSYEYSFEVELIITYGFLIVLCGFLDDRLILKPGLKLTLMIIPSILLILQGIQINDLGNYEFLETLQLGKFSLIFNILAVGLLINSYNYVDGLDGLLITLFSSSLLYFYFLLENENLKNLLLIFFIPLTINLIFNFLPSKSNFKVFLGDSGSLFIGFFMSFFIIFLYKFENIHPAYLIWACWYAVYDFLFVSLKRIVSRKKFYNADKNHFHHFWLKKTNNKQIHAVLIINFINLIVISIGFITAEYFGKIYSLILFILLYLVFWFIRNYHSKLI